MKKFKTALYLLTVVASLACIVSCKKKDAAEEVTKITSEFDATIEQGITNADGSSASNKLEWKDGGNISVFYSNSTANNQFEMSSHSGANAHFRAIVTADADNFLAVSPYHEENNKLSSGDFSCIVPSIQYAVAGSIDSDALLMVAKGQKGQTVTFKNVCAIIKFTAGAEFQSFSIASNNNESLAGTAVVKMDAQGTPTVTASGTNTVILRNTIKKGNTYYITVAPTSLSKGLTISAAIDGKLYSKTTETQSFQFKRNVITDLGTVEFRTSTDGGSGDGTGDGSGDGTGGGSGEGQGGGTDIVVNYETENLGLPSGAIWATVNVGAISPVDPGLYFQWGDPVGYTRDSGHLFTKNTYKFRDGATGYSKYNKSDNKTTLDKEDDAASVNWNENWRVPTQKECVELIENCYWEWTNSYRGTGVSGYIVYKVKNDADKNKLKNGTRHDTTKASYNETDKHIFLPVTGYFSDTKATILHETDGFYWSSSLTQDDPSKAVRMYIYNNMGQTKETIGAEANSGFYRHTGRCIRPIYCGK